MRLRSFAITFFLFSSQIIYSQEPGSSIVVDSSTFHDTKFHSYTPGYLSLLATNIKQEIAAPFHFKKRDWIKAGVIALAGTTLALADEPVQ